MGLKSIWCCSVLCLMVLGIGCGNQTQSGIGRVSPTANSQVALYSISTSKPGKIAVQFGPDTNYGLTTWAQPLQNGTTGLFVAGMKASTPYHLRAVVQFSDGTQFVDSDHLFTTGALDPQQAPTISATTTQGMTPQSGVELLDLIGGNSRPTITDLEGNEFPPIRSNSSTPL